MKKINISFSLIAIVVLSVTMSISYAASGGPLISGLNIRNAAGVAMSMDATAAQQNIVEFVHNSTVPVNVYIKSETYGNWEHVLKSDPSIDGHTVVLFVDSAVKHAWVRIAADYSSVLDKVEKAVGTDSALPEIGSEEFFSVARSAGFEYQEQSDGSLALVWETGISPEAVMQGVTDATAANNQASATPNPGTAKIYWLNNTDARFAVWVLNTNGTRNASSVSDATAPGGWSVVGTGDIDRDGIADIMWFRPSDGAMAYWMMEADGWRKSAGSMGATAPDGWTVVGTGDIDRDGTVDMMWFRPTDGAMSYWLLNTDGTRKDAGSMGATAPDGWTVVGTGDIDRDGTVDMMWFRPTDGAMSFWLLNADGTRKDAGTMGATAPDGWTVVGTGDIDRDGTVDMMWFRPTDGAMSFWLLNADGTRKDAGTMGATAPGGWTVVGTGDIDGDGTTDMMWYRPTDGAMSYWLLNVDGTRKSAATMGATAPGGWTVVGSGSTL